MSEEQKQQENPQEVAEGQQEGQQETEGQNTAATENNGEEDQEKLEQSKQEAGEERGEAEEEAEEQSEMAESTMSVPQPLPQLTSTNRLTKEEIAYGCTFFSNSHGYQNPLNVITAQALQTRLQPVCNMSIHHAGALLRPPFSEKNSRNFADTKEMQDLQLKTLAPCEITDIMNYRVSGCDDVDFAVQSFKMLGAKDENDTIPISRISSLLIDCYQQLDYQLECIDDYKLHCEAVKAQLEADSKKDQNTRAPPSNKKAEQEFILAPEEDILQVILMANGGRDQLTLDDWRALFKNVTQLEFVDYKKQIQQQRLM